MLVNIPIDFVEIIQQMDIFILVFLVKFILFFLDLYVIFRVYFSYILLIDK